MADNLERIVAIEALMAAQGIDMRAPLKTSPRLQQALTAIRAKAPFLATDRPVAPDIEAAAQLVSSGALAAPFADILDPVLQRVE
jgi:histidine ammonia-lyase